MQDLLNKIGITQPGYYSDKNTYIIDFENADQYSKVFSKLDRSKEVKELQSSSISNTSISNVMYVNDDYNLNLIADFDNNVYKLVIYEL